MPFLPFPDDLARSLRESPAHQRRALERVRRALNVAARQRPKAADWSDWTDSVDGALNAGRTAGVGDLRERLLAIELGGSYSAPTRSEASDLRQLLDLALRADDRAKIRQRADEARDFLADNE